MSGSDYSLTPNLGLYKPNYALDVGQWGNHLNANADVLDTALGPGSSFLPISGGALTAHMTGTDLDAALWINTTVDGSGTAGPLTAQMGLRIIHEKTDWTTSTQVGELDGMTINVRQGKKSDAGAILLGVESLSDGYSAAMETQTFTLDPTTLARTNFLGSQLCNIDMTSKVAHGLVLLIDNQSSIAADGLLISSTTSPGWTNFLVCGDTVGTKASINRNGDLFVAGTMTSAGSHGPVYLRSDTAIGILYDGTLNGIQFYMGINVAEITAGGKFLMYGTQVMQARITGWGAATGGSKVAFDAATATLPQTAAVVAQLIADLTTHGLIGT